MNRVSRIAAYLLVVIMGAIGLYRQEQLLQDDKAHRCIAAWETQENVRTAISAASQVPVEALIAVLPNADPARVDAYRTETEHRINEAAADLPDPECDLGAARRRIGN